LASTSCGPAASEAKHAGVRISEGTEERRQIGVGGGGGSWGAEGERNEQPLTSGNITAVGGNFFVTDAEQNFIEGGIINILFSDSTSTNWAPPSVSDFIGFVFDTPVASMTLSPVASPTFVTAGTITVGQVPEPSTYALLLMTGAGALWLARRRR
jgi:hypothetical protein